MRLRALSIFPQSEIRVEGVTFILINLAKSKKENTIAVVTSVVYSNAYLTKNFVFLFFFYLHLREGIPIRFSGRNSFSVYLLFHTFS